MNNSKLKIAVGKYSHFRHLKSSTKIFILENSAPLTAPFLALDRQEIDLDRREIDLIHRKSPRFPLQNVGNCAANRQPLPTKTIGIADQNDRFCNATTAIFLHKSAVFAITHYAPSVYDCTRKTRKKPTDGFFFHSSPTLRGLKMQILSCEGASLSAFFCHFSAPRNRFNTTNSWCLRKLK